MSTKRQVKTYKYESKTGEDGRNYLIKTYVRSGVFVGYGLETQEEDTTVASYTAAIVEFPDGTVELLHPDLIQFEAFIQLTDSVQVQVRNSKVDTEIDPE